MRAGRVAAFLLQAVTVGLALAFVVLILRPDLLGQLRPIVELTTAPEASRPPTTLPLSFADAVAGSAPAIVNIHTATVVTAEPLRFADPVLQRIYGDAQDAPRQRVEAGAGSGVVVSSDGYVLTNNHVVFGASEIHVQFNDGRTAPASLVGLDPEADLAVLKVDLEGLEAIVIGAVDTLRVGDVVLAIGNPFGVGQTVTMGIISATGRRRLGISTFENFIQTDAAINPGNSGGALINTAGELVGISTAIFSQSGGSDGIGFAIPADIATQSLRQIIEQGRVVRGWLGVQIMNLSGELAQQLNTGDATGVVVAALLEGGPAESAGLRPGDLITEIANQPLADADAAVRRITMLEPGREVTLTGIRDGTPRQWRATIAERPSPRVR